MYFWDFKNSGNQQKFLLEHRTQLIGNFIGNHTFTENALLSEQDPGLELWIYQNGMHVLNHICSFLYPFYAIG